MTRRHWTFSPIGTIHSEHRDPARTPVQPVFAQGCRGRAVVFAEYAEGLSDLAGFSHVYLLYAFHRAGAPRLTVRPFLQNAERGVFATRAPCRPNPLGLSIVRLLRRRGNILYLDGLDVLDGTPLLDIKPYTAMFDCLSTARNGWQDQVSEATARSRGVRGFRRGAPGRAGQAARADRTEQATAARARSAERQSKTRR